MESRTVRVAIAQASPEYLDGPGSLEKACRLIREAGEGGAELVAFNEGFIPGHPLWYHFHPATAPRSRELATRLIENSIVMPGPATEALAAAARDASCDVVIGVAERMGEHAGTIFNSQVTIGRDGRILNVHRKLTPTVGERLVHAPGDASGLRGIPAEAGRVGGLICGESSNPLSLLTLTSESVEILVISWPEFPGRGMLPRSERALVAGRSAAFMTKAFVLNAVGVVNDDMRRILRTGTDDDVFLDDLSLTGGSSIVGPDGNVVAGPVDHEEQILYADLDLSRCLYEKSLHDFSGHYNRPDIFNVTVDRQPHRLVNLQDGGSDTEELGNLFLPDDLGIELHT